MVFKLNCIMMVETRILTLCRRKGVQLCFIMSPGKIIFAVLELLPVSPVPPNFMIFGIRGQFTDVMSDCVKLLVNRFRGYWVLISQKLPFPIDLLRRPYNSARTAVRHCDKCQLLGLTTSALFLPVLIRWCLRLFLWK